MVRRSGRASDPKNTNPIHRLRTRNPKKRNTIPMPTGIRSVTIHTHQTSP